MNLIYKDLLAYLNKQKIIDSYTKLLEIEKEIENIIDSKIYSKSKEAKYIKYEIYSAYYSKYKNKFREKDSNYKTTLIKQINPVTKEVVDPSTLVNYINGEVIIDFGF